jgi:CheY-like chemotaxis protein
MENGPCRIILADDDEVDRLLFKDALQELKIKHHVDTVNNGIELLMYLNNKNNTLPHIIFLDLKMPRKTGLECLKAIRNNDRFNQVAVAIYSTSASKTDIEDTFHFGANVYINKPNDFNILKQALLKVVSAVYLFQEPPFNMANFILKL